MATYSLHQVIPGSLDTAGISTSTSNCQVDDPRQGQFYNLNTLAAAAPVWFHRLSDGRYVGIFSRIFSGARVSPDQPGSGPLLFRSATQVVSPYWGILDPATGAVTGVETIPTSFVGQRVLVSAISRGDYLFVLFRIGDTAVVQHFRVGTQQALVLQAEEAIPEIVGLGLYADRNDLWVFGRKTTGRDIFIVRKNWGRIGNNTSASPRMQWQYRSVNGWSTDPLDMSALPGVVSDGPVSVAEFGNRFYISVSLYAPGEPAVLGIPPIETPVPEETIRDTATTILSGALSPEGGDPLTILPSDVIFQEIIDQLSATTGLIASGITNVINRFNDTFSTIVEGFVDFISQITLGLIVLDDEGAALISVVDSFTQALLDLIGSGDMVFVTPQVPFVPAVPGTWTSVVYAARSLESAGWSRHPGFSVSLGDDHTYCGGTVHFQPQLALTPGYTTTQASHGETVLDEGSDQVQVFKGLAGQIVKMPRTSPPGKLYTFFNKTIGYIRVLSYDGQEIIAMRYGTTITLHSTRGVPTGAGDWSVAPSSVRNPTSRTGFPYVSTTRYEESIVVGDNQTKTDFTLLVAWDAFEV